MKIEELKEKIKRRIQRNDKSIAELESKKDILSGSGHWSLGYFKGANTTMENILDELELLELENSVAKKTPKECYEKFGLDLDGCSTQENEGCVKCLLYK